MPLILEVRVTKVKVTYHWGHQIYIVGFMLAMLMISILLLALLEFEPYHFGEGYLAGPSRQIISYLAGQSRQIISYLAGHVPPNNFLFGGTCPAK